MNNNNTQELVDKIAQLESQNDHLLAELSTLDSLMRQVGFAQGIKTIKATAEELIKQAKLEQTKETS